MVYDVQDLGNRSYTFISTLGYVMDEAAKDNVQVIVLDRPNPLGGVRIEGPRLDSSFNPSFVGLYNIPYVYGLTPGELALWINAKYLDKPCRLSIISMKGWIRPMVWEDTGLKWGAHVAEYPHHRRRARLHRDRIPRRNRHRNGLRRPESFHDRPEPRRQRTHLRLEVQFTPHPRGPRPAYR